MQSKRTLFSSYSPLRTLGRIRATPILLLLALLTTSPGIHADADRSDTARTFVMVHGATAGGWEWKRAAAFLTDGGHTVYRATLTGLGERHHLATAEVDLDTHIDDVVNLILFEDLHDIVLTGHSYGGMVVTGVMNRIPERIRQVIFLDAAVPEDGESIYDLFDGPQVNRKVVDGLVYFPWFDPEAKPPHGVPHPEKTFTQAVSYDNPAAFELPVTYVAFVPADQSVEEREANDKGWQRAKSRGWSVRVFPGGHVAHQEDPKGVASLIEELVAE